MHKIYCETECFHCGTYSLHSSHVPSTYVAPACECGIYLCSGLAWGVHDDGGGAVSAKIAMHSRVSRLLRRLAIYKVCEHCRKTRFFTIKLFGEFLTDIFSRFIHSLSWVDPVYVTLSSTFAYICPLASYIMLFSHGMLSITYIPIPICIS